MSRRVFVGGGGDGVGSVGVVVVNVVVGGAGGVFVGVVDGTGGSVVVGGVSGVCYGRLRI